MRGLPVDAVLCSSAPSSPCFAPAAILAMVRLDDDIVSSHSRSANSAPSSSESASTAEGIVALCVRGEEHVDFRRQSPYEPDWEGRNASSRVFESAKRDVCLATAQMEPRADESL